MSGDYKQNGLWAGPTGDFNTSVEDTPFALGQLGKVMAAPFTSRVVDTETADFDVSPTPRVVQYVQRVTNATEDATPSVGDLAYWNDIDAVKVAANTENAIGQTDGPKLCAGVFLGDASLTVDVPLTGGKYGYIQVGGIAPVRVYGSIATTTLGYPLVVGVTEGKAVVRYGVSATTEGAVSDTLATYQLVGYALTSTTVATGGAAFVQALLALPTLGR